MATTLTAALPGQGELRLTVIFPGETVDQVVSLGKEDRVHLLAAATISSGDYDIMLSGVDPENVPQVLRTFSELLGALNIEVKEKT